MRTMDFISLLSGLMMEGKRGLLDQHYENFRYSVIRGDLGKTWVGLSSVHISEVQSFKKKKKRLHICVTPEHGTLSGHSHNRW